MTRPHHLQASSTLRHLPFRRSAVAGAVLHLILGIAILSPSVAPTQAYAQTTEAARTYNIPAGQLTGALNRFGYEAGIMLSFSTEMTDGKQTRGLQGTHAPSAGLDALLVDTGLQAVRQKNGGYVLQQAPESSARETTLAPVTVRAMRDLNTEGSGSYTARGTSLYKGTNSLKDIPQTISVITRQQMDDQGFTDLQQVMDQSPGILTAMGTSTYTGNKSYGSDFYSRGFQVQSYMLDGVVNSAIDSGNTGLNVGLSGSAAIYDRVEVLRGAAGLLVGSGSPGGTVNLVRKRPTAEAQQRYTLSAGSWSNYYGEADLSGPINEAGTLRGRFVTAYQDRDYFWDVTHAKSPLLYGIVEADISPATRISLGARYEKFKETGPRVGTFFLMNYNPPRSYNPSPYWGNRGVEEKEIFLDVKHEINDRWHVAIAASQKHMDDYRVLPKTEAHNGAALIQVRGGETKANSLDASLVGAFDAFGREHKLTFGFNSSVKEYAGYFRNCLAPSCVSYQYDYLNFDPYTSWQLGATEQAFIEATMNGPRRNNTTTSYGAFGKLDYNLTDKLTFILAGRLSWYEYEYYEFGGIFQPTRGGKVSKEFTPLLGLTYALNNQWSAYASYADIFRPQWGSYTRSGNLIEHEKGKNYELGLKGELYEGRLNTAFSIYQVDLENTAMLADPPYDQVCSGNPTGGGCYVNSGHKRTRGFDAEVNGQLLPGWQASAGYTYTWSKNIRSATNEGEDFSTTAEGYQMPKHMLKLWSSYRLGGALSGLTFGGGATAQSKVVNNSYPQIKDGGRTIWNAFARYEINKRWSASFNINNVFDKVYWPYATSNVKSIYGEPRSYKLTLQAKF